MKVYNNVIQLCMYPFFQILFLIKLLHNIEQFPVFYSRSLVDYPFLIDQCVHVHPKHVREFETAWFFKVLGAWDAAHKQRPHFLPQITISTKSTGCPSLGRFFQQSHFTGDRTWEHDSHCWKRQSLTSSTRWAQCPHGVKIQDAHSHTVSGLVQSVAQLSLLWFQSFC